MPPAPQGNQPDNSMGVLWIIAAIFGISIVIWHMFKRQLVYFYLQIKIAEINLIGLFTNRLVDVKTALEASDPSQFTFNEVVKIGQLVGDYLCIPLFLLVFALAFLIYFANTTRHFKRNYSMKDLVHLEKGNWPQITPVANLDLIKVDIDKGPWAMALTPMQFSKRHQLLIEYRAQPREGVSRKQWNRLEVSLKRGQASRIFALQLGPLWQGVERLPLHVRALFAVFSARNNNDTKTALDLLAQISASANGKLNFSGTDALWQKHINTKAVQTAIHSHAYVFTVMATMLELAREDGVQASADFLWLKPVDRKLWYMLNTVGRQTPFVEVAGIFAHWIAEKEIGRPILVPLVDEATNALEVALKEIIYTPDEQTQS